MNIAPVVLFCYNRPSHVLQTLEALSKNDLAKQSILYIYCDGAKKDTSREQLEKISETRAIVKSRQWCKEIHIIEQEENKGLANSIEEGVTKIVNKYGRIIVLEDDIVTSKGFLKYMNDALDIYEEEEQVMHISGYMYPHKKELPETFFFNVPLCWGWATWKGSWAKFNKDSLQLWKTITNQNRWADFNKFGHDYLQSQLAGNITGYLNTWFIKWHASVFLNNGYTLFPNTSLVQNIGFDSSGTHKDNNAKHYYIQKIKSTVKVEEQNIKENSIALQAIKEFYNKVHYKKSIFYYLSFNGFKYVIIKLINKVLKINIKNQSNIYHLVFSYTGKNVKIYPKVEVHNSLIGNYTYIAHNSFINNTYIGKFCSIGPNLMCGRGIHPIYGVSTSPMFYSTKKQNGISLCLENKVNEHVPVEIGNDVFIGANVTILDGVEIGDGAVIGAGAVVSKNIPAYAIAVGNPIKIIKYRFTEEQIEDLKKIKWWNFSDDKLQSVEKYFNEIEEFIKTNTKTD